MFGSRQLNRFGLVALILKLFSPVEAKQPEVWYWCGSAGAYYPCVLACPEPWRSVPATQPELLLKPTPPPQSSPALPPSSSPLPADPFREGQADRGRWEAWIIVQVGDFKRGADYWAANRNTTNPGSCGAIDHPGVNAEWVSGCRAAQQLLAAIDVRRKTEPEYRRGFNAFHEMPAGPAATVTAPGSTAGTPDRDTDKAFADCLLAKSKDGDYSSFDGGKSAVRLLGACPTE